MSGLVEYRVRKIATAWVVRRVRRLETQIDSGRKHTGSIRTLSSRHDIEDAERSARALQLSGLHHVPSAEMGIPQQP